MYFLYIKRLPGIVISFSFAENNDKSKLGFRPKKTCSVVLILVFLKIISPRAYKKMYVGFNWLIDPGLVNIKPLNYRFLSLITKHSNIYICQSSNFKYLSA